MLHSAINALRGIYDRATYAYPVALREVLTGSKSILDVGCGRGSPVSCMKDSAHLVGVDAHAPSIDESKRLGLHHEYHLQNVLEIDEIFGPGSFECVAALDLIEHLKKEDGLRLLDVMERIASKRVVIFTPNGFLQQGEYDSNPWQVHLSGWTADEMRKRGYRVIGINGWRPLRGEYGYVRFKPKLLWALLSDLTEFVVRSKPEHAFQILCVKEITSGEDTGQRN